MVSTEVDPIVTQPYVTVASFRAYPSLLALGDLNQYSAVQGDQDAELFNLLLLASQWATDTCDQPLHAHAHIEQGRARTRSDGAIVKHAEHSPVRSLTGFSYGYNGAANQTAVTDLTAQWIEDSQLITLPWGAGLNGAGFGSLQFSSPLPSTSFYATWSYVAGFANTVLAATAAAGATAITVIDPTGIYAGDVLRIWEPGKEEAVTVGAAYAGGATVPLTTALKFTHTFVDLLPANQIGVSMMPPSAREAVQKYTLATLLRPTTQAEDPWPGNAPNVSTRKGDARQNGAGLVKAACSLISNYRRVR
jgi:hypothetical protein